MMMHVPLMFLSEWRDYPSAPCLAEKKTLMTARVSMLLKSRASPDMLPFSLCNKKRLAIRHMNRPLFPTTLSIPCREVGRAKDLTAPPRKAENSLKKRKRLETYSSGMIWKDYFFFILRCQTGQSSSV